MIVAAAASNGSAEHTKRMMGPQLCGLFGQEGGRYQQDGSLLAIDSVPQILLRRLAVRAWWYATSVALVTHQLPLHDVFAVMQLLQPQDARACCRGSVGLVCLCCECIEQQDVAAW